MVRIVQRDGVELLENRETQNIARDLAFSKFYIRFEVDWTVQIKFLPFAFFSVSLLR